jgi:hypothetical protein
MALSKEAELLESSEAINRDQKSSGESRGAREHPHTPSILLNVALARDGPPPWVGQLDVNYARSRLCNLHAILLFSGIF